MLHDEARKLIIEAWNNTQCEKNCSIAWRECLCGIKFRSRNDLCGESAPGRRSRIAVLFETRFHKRIRMPFRQIGNF